MIDEATLHWIVATAGAVVMTFVYVCIRARESIARLEAVAARVPALEDDRKYMEWKNENQLQRWRDDQEELRALRKMTGVMARRYDPRPELSDRPMHPMPEPKEDEDATPYRGPYHS